MSFTISIRSLVESAETLARSTLEKFYVAWNVSNVINQTVTVPYNTTTNLLAATTYLIQADPLATMVVGWVHSANTVELPVNQMTLIAPPNTPYLRNTSTDSTSTPIPVKVIAYS